MAEDLTDRTREFLSGIQGSDIDLNTIRKELKINPNSKAWDHLRVVLHRMCDGERPLLRRVGRKEGQFHVITQVKPVSVFSGRERRPAYNLVFPRDRDTLEQMAFADDIVVREGDLFLISGVSNFGKTTLILNWLAENIDTRPVLMGNEYTTWNTDMGEYEPTPRFLNRLDHMTWVEWCNGDGQEKFELLPVRDDYASHIRPNRINLIDWINLDEHYMIGNVLDGIKRRLGKGIGIVAIQKAEGASAGRGGQFTKDFADCELLIDSFGKEILLTVGKVKEPKGSVLGRTFAYSIWDGVKIKDFREVIKCTACKGTGYKSGHPCDWCGGKKYIDKGE